MNARAVAMLLFLTLAGSVAVAAVRHNGPDLQPTLEDREGPIPRIVVTAKRSQESMGDCEAATPRVVVTAQRPKAG